MNRRNFLKYALTAAGVAVVAPELLLPRDPKRVYFLPPGTGWYVWKDNGRTLEWSVYNDPDTWNWNPDQNTIVMSPPYSGSQQAIIELVEARIKAVRWSAEDAIARQLFSQRS